MFNGGETNEENWYKLKYESHLFKMCLYLFEWKAVTSYIGQRFKGKGILCLLQRVSRELVEATTSISQTSSAHEVIADLFSFFFHWKLNPQLSCVKELTLLEVEGP